MEIAAIWLTEAGGWKREEESYLRSATRSLWAGISLLLFFYTEIPRQRAETTPATYKNQTPVRANMRQQVAHAEPS